MMEMSNREILQEIFGTSKSALEQAGFNVRDYKEIDYGVQFSISEGGWKGLIRIYRNKKGVVKYDYSPIKEDEKKHRIIEALEGHKDSTPDQGANGHEANKLDNFKPNIGTDESGKGDYFGPLVAAGVYVDARTKTILDRIGVRDSKKISDAKILELARTIRNICHDQYAVIEITPPTYNNLYDTFQREGKNLNMLLAWGHAKAIEEVLTKVDCENAVSDKFADERFILSKLQEKGRRINLTQEHKAESHTAVAAASILARARFLERMKNLSEEYGMELSKGASPQVVEQAKLLVEKHGQDQLANVAKMHFKTTVQVLD